MINKFSVWWNAEKASVHAGVAVATVYRAARRGDLKGYKLNRARVWRFRQSDVDTWLYGGNVATAYRVDEADGGDRT